MGNAKFIEKWCLKKIKDIQKEIVYDLPKDIEKTARLNFNRAKQEIPASDDYIDVWSKIINEHSAEVVCGGTQVLFVEFGAGIAHKSETPTVITNDDNVDVEFAQRPNGIYDIGGYGKHRGLDDSWIFQDTNLIPDNGKNHTHMIRANDNYFVYRTGGIKPVRGLYRAIASGVRKLTTKKVKKIAPSPMN